ncbi:hemerythrin domain-containing protein [Moraxella nasovis]|uniref:hemerythrin domain-containing protein n=1 Tax=Moraxella nasovis TaxID=2904121 RepID=UPI001F615F35|nr:hemerythrin domain-containing protein [Moraxella nasovis]UNU72618.1 hemerythrin domain-containing protein [Moraxella nasovis]
MENIDIFTALIKSHDVQRKLCDSLEMSLKDKDRKQAEQRYEPLRIELQAHAAAEERHLYVPVMKFDDGLDLSRHAIAEHHEMDEMMQVLSDGRTGDERFFETATKLIDEVRHHLKEEENNFFKDAKQLLDTQTQKRLGVLYQAEHESFEERND